MTIKIASMAAVILAPATVIATSQPARVIPTVYEAGHFYAVPQTANGQELRLLVDTGGGGGSGMYWITQPAANRLGLKVRACEAEGESLSVADVPNFAPERGLPPPLLDRSPCGKTLLVQGDAYPGNDGQLGAGYLPGRVWTFDYPARRLILEGTSWRPDPKAHATALGFLRDAKGNTISGFARVTVDVDGQEIDMLLDTGATAHPTEAGKKASGTSTVRGEGVTSYITQSVFERWHKEHPQWRVVQAGDDLFGPSHVVPIIEVPKVKIAGWTVGPVWFTLRPDKSFHEFMGQWMDKKPDGSVGANIFRHFVMTLDYPNAAAYFRCADDCKAAAAVSN